MDGVFRGSNFNTQSKSSMKRVTLFCLGAVCGLAVLLALLRLAETCSPDPSERIRRIAKERFRTVHQDKHSLPGPVSKAPINNADFDEVADRAINVTQEIRAGDRRWETTVLHLLDLHYLSDDRIQCAAQYAMSLNSPCGGTIDLVLDPSVDGFGEVLYARSNATADAPEDTNACAAYVGCLARTRVGSVIPLPLGFTHERLVAIRQESRYAWASPALFDIERVKELITLRQNDLAVGIEAGKIGEFDRLSEERLITYLQKHLATLTQQKSEEGATWPE